MANTVMDLSAFKGARPAQAFAALNPQDDGLADGIGSSYGIIGYKGKNWTLRYHGEKKPFLRPDDGTPIGYIDVIILRSAHQKSKSYYAAFDPNASEGARPICASLDGVVPDLDVQTKQSDTCALCPRNQWRTNPAGRRERECNDYKRLSVLLLPSQTARMFGQGIMEPVFLRVPPGSLESLLQMSDVMKAQGFHSATYITRISFDPNEAHPSLVFTPLQPLTDQESPVVLPLVNSEEAKRITGEDVMSGQRRPAIAAPSTAPQIAAPVQQPVQQQPVSAASLVAASAPPPAQNQPVATGLVAPSTNIATPVQPNPAPVKEPVTLDLQPVQTGLVDVGANPSVGNGAFAVAPGQPNGGPAATAVVQSVADVGPPQESDAAMDDRIANILGK